MPHDLGASALIAALALGITIFGFHRQNNRNNNDDDDAENQNQESEASSSLRSTARESMFSSFKRRIGSFGGYSASYSNTPRSTMPSYNSDTATTDTTTPPEPGDNHSTSASSDSGGSSSAAAKSSLSSFMTRGAATSPASASTDSKKKPPPPQTKKKKKKKKKDEIPKEWTEKVPQLANFDACVAAADALAAAPLPASNNADHEAMMAAAGNSSLTRLDKASGLVHTSVLVSPEGTLLLVPPGMMSSPDKLPLSNYFQQHSQHRQQQQQQQQPMRLEDDEEDGHDGASPPEEEAEAAAAETPEVPPPVEEISTPASAEAPAEESAPAADDDDDDDARKETTDEQGREVAAAEEEGDDDDDERNHTAAAATAVDNTDNRSTASSTESIFSELLWNSKEEYAAAVFCGHDLDERGDLALNGFSAKGWSLPAASFAVRQAHASLEHWADFCHAIILARKESAVKTHQACDALRAQVPRLGGHNPPGVAAITAASPPQQADDASWELVFDPKTTDFMPTARRSGPLLGGNGSLVHAVCSLEEYYSASAEAESSTWRHATVHQGAVLPQLQAAVEQLHRRAVSREQALEEASKRVRSLEARVAQLKGERDKKWQAVVKAEEKVTQRMQVLRQERTRQREKARMVQLREAAANSRNNNTTSATQQQQQQHRKNQASSEQVWDMVAAISDNMDSSSFEPVHLTPRAGAADAPPALVAAHSEDNEAPADAVSREAMEAEGRLPELRAVAWQADEAIDEAAALLLQALSHLDATRRSARVAAETALLAAANAQAATLSQLVQLERAAVQERLQHLEQLEAQLPQVDVRADLHAYIAADVADLGGRSHLGDDDDGGIASALATLSRHVDVQHGEAAALDERRSEEEDEDEIDNLLNKSVSRDQVRNAVDSLFFEKPTGEALERADIDEAVAVLCRVAALEPSPRQRNRRMTLCYALNSQRSSKAALQSQPQFDGLVQVFDAVLTSCAHDDDDNDTDSSRLADAKMLMMLAQTFYLPPETTTTTGEDVPDTSEPPTPTSHQGRSRRLYIKSRLTQHAIWSKDDFWDVALAQQISEALSQSGVILSNFERPLSSRAQRGGDGAFGKSRHLQWHDLSLQERVGAASQVHAVVFAQLGALAHSMLEFGCGLPRSCAFVRRMAVRHALPSAQRNMLLQHLMMAAAQQDDDNNNKEEAKHDDDDKKPHDDETKAKAPEQPVAIDTDDAS